MGEVLENGVYLPDEGERNAYNGLKGNWNTVDTVVAQVQALSSTGLIRKPVDELPTEDIETNVIYMLKAVKPNGDVYRIEYMYIDNHWDALGTSETTLDDYYTKAETDDLPAVKSGINVTRVSNYDAHLANNDVHVTLANKQSWDGKQNALDTAQTAAVNSGVTGTKVTGYDTHVSDTDIHVTASDKQTWNGKQDGLSQTQLAAVNSGVTSAKVTGYDNHVADTNVHVTTADKAAWNGKQNALTQTQLNNIAAVPDKANSADLATVATTGDYGDLLNAPAIPTVNNATLTIQKNGADVATFTANASSNVTANLAIPVNTSDLNNDAGFLTQHNPVDDTLSATSVNALQNKIVKSELDGKAPLVHTHAASDVTSGTFNIARIPNLDASKITSGTIDIARLPKGALERLVKVANQAARYALTTDDVQLGDTVQQLDTGVMYIVTDETKLDSADGYTEFTAGAASSVPWMGVTGKPADYPPASHSHGNITNDGKVGTTANKPLITGTDGVVQAGSFGTAANTFCEGNDSRLSDARTPVAHTHTKSDVTDLLNSGFIPSANNSYDLGSSAYQWNNLYAKKTYTDTVKAVTGSLTLQSNGSNNSIAIYNGTSATDGGGIWLYGKDHSNGSVCRIQIYNTSKSHYERMDLVNSQFLPNPSGEIDLGTSTNKWKSVYSDSYYYGTTAWGLDQNNTWSQINDFKTLRLYGAASNSLVMYPPSGEKGDSSTFGFNIICSDKNAGGYSASGVANIGMGQSGGTSYVALNASTKGSTDNNTHSIQIGLQITASDNANIGSFYPTQNGGISLGTSTNKWKSLNGINPGALSLPSGGTTENTDWFNVAGDILPTGGNATDFTGGQNFFTPSKDGWLALSVASCESIVTWVLGLKYGLSVVAPNANENKQLIIPVVAGKQVEVKVKGSRWLNARLIVTQGNV